MMKKQWYLRRSDVASVVGQGSQVEDSTNIGALYCNWWCRLYHDHSRVGCSLQIGHTCCPYIGNVGAYLMLLLLKFIQLGGTRMSLSILNIAAWLGMRALSNQVRNDSPLFRLYRNIGRFMWVPNFPDFLPIFCALQPPPTCFGTHILLRSLPP